MTFLYINRTKEIEIEPQRETIIAQKYECLEEPQGIYGHCHQQTCPTNINNDNLLEQRSNKIRDGISSNQNANQR